MTSPTWAIDGVRRRLRDESQTHPFVDDAAIELAVQGAVRDHSRYKPRVIILDIEGDDTSFYELAEADGWIREFSQINHVEFPIATLATDTRRPMMLEHGLRGWLLYRTPDADYLQLVQETASPDQFIRVTFTSTHSLADTGGGVDGDEELNTILGYDTEAVLDLAAGIAAGIASGRSATGRDGAIRTTTANPGGSFERLSTLKKLWRARYFQHIGGMTDPEEGGDGVRAASVIMDTKYEPSHTMGLMTHGRWRR